MRLFFITWSGSYCGMVMLVRAETEEAARELADKAGMPRHDPKYGVVQCDEVTIEGEAMVLEEFSAGS